MFHYNKVNIFNIKYDIISNSDGFSRTLVSQLKHENVVRKQTLFPFMFWMRMKLMEINVYT